MTRFKSKKDENEKPPHHHPLPYMRPTHVHAWPHNPAANLKTAKTLGVFPVNHLRSCLFEKTLSYRKKFYYFGVSNKIYLSIFLIAE